MAFTIEGHKKGQKNNLEKTGNQKNDQIRGRAQNQSKPSPN